MDIKVISFLAKLYCSAILTILYNDMCRLCTGFNVIVWYYPSNSLFINGRRFERVKHILKVNKRVLHIMRLWITKEKGSLFYLPL